MPDNPPVMPSPHRRKLLMWLGLAAALGLSIWGTAFLFGIELIPQPQDSLPQLSVAGWAALTQGQRQAEGPGDRAQPYLLLGTNDTSPEAVGRLTRALAARGWRRWPQNDSQGSLAFWQGDRTHYLYVGAFPGDGLHPSLDEYGLRPGDLQAWQSRFKRIEIIENVHLYSTRPLFD